MQLQESSEVFTETGQVGVVTPMFDVMRDDSEKRIATRSEASFRLHYVVNRELGDIC